MVPFSSCPVCGGEQVEKLLRGGNYTAVLEAQAEVCRQCGGRLYSVEAVRQFEQIRAKLEH